jgi:hypothetical protein
MYIYRYIDTYIHTYIHDSIQEALTWTASVWTQTATAPGHPPLSSRMLWNSLLVGYNKISCEQEKHQQGRHTSTSSFPPRVPARGMSNDYDNAFHYPFISTSGLYLSIESVIAVVSQLQASTNIPKNSSATPILWSGGSISLTTFKNIIKNSRVYTIKPATVIY